MLVIFALICGGCIGLLFGSLFKISQDSDYCQECPYKDYYFRKE